MAVLSFVDSDENTDRGPTLGDLPNELIRHILTFLDTDRPSKDQFKSIPQARCTKSASTPLKNFASVCHKLRVLALPILFKHATVFTSELSNALFFFDQSGLSRQIESVTAYLEGPLAHTHPAWWARLLNALPVTVLTISCAPHMLSEIATLQVSMDDSWAFDMPRHLLELRQSPREAARPIPYDDLVSLLAAKQWTSFKVNEGSSLIAYDDYEYFFRKPPSLLSTVAAYFSSIQHNAGPEAYQQRFGPSAAPLLGIRDLFVNLQHFTLVAIFPYYNHVDNILKCIRRMPNLQSLCITLCPEKGTTILQEGLDEFQGSMDESGLWEEVNTSYELLNHTIAFLQAEGQLREVTIGDTWVKEINSDGVSQMMSSRSLRGWLFDGQATWRKP